MNLNFEPAYIQRFLKWNSFLMLDLIGGKVFNFAIID